MNQKYDKRYEIAEAAIAWLMFSLLWAVVLMAAMAVTFVAINMLNGS